MSDSMCSKMKKRKRLKGPKPKNYKCIVDFIIVIYLVLVEIKYKYNEFRPRFRLKISIDF